MLAHKYYTSRKLICRTVGAYSAMQEQCENLFIFLGLQTFDLQLNITMVILILRSGSNVDTEGIVILSVGIPVTITYFVLGCISALKEKKRVGYLYVTLLLLASAYIIFKVYQSVDHLVHTNGQNSTTSTSGTSQQPNALSGTTLTCAVLAVITRVSVVIYFVKTFRNFGKGLKEKGKRYYSIVAYRLVVIQVYQRLD
ncbi:uncharacterized protein LOC125663569 [Ostrea edulis]|uniref:uncharacterized protein LOC125663569 n=1 Tax=Ostrea edulis TaxID=37623 RepID=UPI0024AF53E7|nr:uncharacterized protein LOC125663569 [Ostrea edulis]